MAGKLEQLVNSPQALRLALAFARSVPPRPGYAIAGRAGRWFAGRRAAGPVQAVSHVGHKELIPN